MRVSLVEKAYGGRMNTKHCLYTLYSVFESYVFLIAAGIILEHAFYSPRTWLTRLSYATIATLVQRFAGYHPCAR